MNSKKKFSYEISLFLTEVPYLPNNPRIGRLMYLYYSQHKMTYKPLYNIEGNDPYSRQTTASVPHTDMSSPLSQLEPYVVVVVVVAVC